MADKPFQRFRRFLAELRRRNVYQVAATYAVVAFVLIQVADLTFVRLGLPSWTVTLVIVLVAIGFPLALVLAWAFELTPEVVRRTAPRDATQPEAEATSEEPSPAEERRSRSLVVIQALVGLVLVLAASAAGGCEAPDRTSARNDSLEVRTLTFATGEQPISAPVYLAHRQGFFAEEGLDVELLPRPTGATALAEVIDGRADLATTAETPVVHAVLQRDTVFIVATIATTRRGLTVIGRRDRGIRDPTDLAGTRVGVTRGTNVEYFLHLLLARHGVSLDSVDLVDVGPDHLGVALTRGRTDAIVWWEPHRSRLARELGDAAVQFGAPTLYTWFWNVVASPRLVRRNPEALRALLRALRRAAAFIASRPARARDIVADEVGIDMESMKPGWGHLTYSVSLDQALLLTMEHQARWLQASDEEGPNFLTFIETAPLRALAPEAVSVLDAGGSP